ncbi:MAG: dihydrofolate reductase family protein [Candidatus Berkelbacteria bacterium]
MRPKTQLFMLISVDGKISTGDSDLLDFDQDLPKIVGAKEGLRQYYDIEKTTDVNSFNTGRVMAKIGFNDPKKKVDKIPCNFIIADNSHLTSAGVKNLSKRAIKLYLATNNKNHPACKMDLDNLVIVEYSDFANLFERLGSQYKMKRLTVQSGGNINAELVRSGLIDKLSIVVAPVIVGGKDTSSLVDGESVRELSGLSMIKALELLKVTKLKNSYLHLEYKVLN